MMFKYVFIRNNKVWRIQNVMDLPLGPSLDANSEEEDEFESAEESVKPSTSNWSGSDLREC